MINFCTVCGEITNVTLENGSLICKCCWLKKHKGFDPRDMTPESMREELEKENQ